MACNSNIIKQHQYKGGHRGDVSRAHRYNMEKYGDAKAYQMMVEKWRENNRKYFKRVVDID